MTLQASGQVVGGKVYRQTLAAFVSEHMCFIFAYAACQAFLRATPRDEPRTQKNAWPFPSSKSHTDWVCKSYRNGTNFSPPQENCCKDGETKSPGAGKSEIKRGDEREMETSKQMASVLALMRQQLEWAMHAESSRREHSVEASEALEIRMREMEVAK